MVELRPYQTDGENKIRDAFRQGFKAPLYVLPTGGGKTVTFASIAHSAARRLKRVLILAHRVELVDQIVTTLKNVDVVPDIIAAGYNRSMGRFRAAQNSVAVASVQTLARRLSDYPPPTLIICDEAHHVAGGNTWSTIFRHYDGAKILGVTATPIRLDGRGLASHFDTMIVGPSVADLIAMGYLAPPRIFAPPTVDTSGLHTRAGEFQTAESESLMDTPSITGDALSHYKKHAAGLPALAFATSVAHAHHIAEQFRKSDIVAVALDGGTDRERRRMVVQDFREGKIKVLASCDLFSEGFDVPGVHVGIMLRPTASEGLYRQQVGRILRTAPGKTHAIILDHAGNTQRFGMPAEPREWELTVDAERQKKKPLPGVRVCPKCFAASPARASACVECGHIFEVKPRAEVATKEGELIELTAEQMQRKRERREQGRSRSLAELEEFARMKNYAPGWAAHIWNAREAKKQKGTGT